MPMIAGTLLKDRQLVVLPPPPIPPEKSFLPLPSSLCFCSTQHPKRNHPLLDGNPAATSEGGAWKRGLIIILDRSPGNLPFAHSRHSLWDLGEASAAPQPRAVGGICILKQLPEISSLVPCMTCMHAPNKLNTCRDFKEDPCLLL